MQLGTTLRSVWAFSHLLFLALLLHGDNQAVLALFHPLHHGRREHLHAALFQQLTQVLPQLLVHGGQQPTGALHQGHLAAQVVVKGGKFRPDDAAAHDDDGVIEFVRPLHQLVRGQDAGQVQAGDRRAQGHGASGR